MGAGKVLTTHGLAKLALLGAPLFEPTDACICCNVGVTDGVGVGVGTGVWETETTLFIH